MTVRGALPHSDWLHIIYMKLAHSLYFVMPTMTQE
jgi:hypothetical protein